MTPMGLHDFCYLPYLASLIHRSHLRPAGCCCRSTSWGCPAAVSSSTPSPPRSASIYARNGALYADDDAVYGKNGAVYGDADAVDCNDDAVHGDGDAVYGDDDALTC
eukprot:1058356-Rhodomonas_salina.1